MASVSGMRRRMTVPSPGCDSTSMVPPMDSMLVLTTSMPTPRPETLVTAAAVEKPGRKISCRTSVGLILARASWVSRPRSTALAPTLAGSMPAPSSATSTTTWPLSCRARRVSTPSVALPAAARPAAASMPWSTELRTRWVSGSLTASSSVLSSSVSRPSISRRTFLPHCRPRSRTTRGSLDQMWSIGCMRVFMTPSCSSLAIRFSRWEARTRSWSVCRPTYWTIWLRVSTSSPTSSISASSRSTSTRMVLSATARRPGWAPVAADSSAGRSGSTGTTGASTTGVSTTGASTTGASTTGAAATATATGGAGTGTCSTAGTGAGDGTAALARGAGSAGAFVTATSASSSSTTGASGTGASAGTSSSAALIVATVPATSTEPSPPEASMAASRARMVSTICSSASVRRGVRSSAPSRSRGSMFSPTCATSSSRLKARKPLVPLIVWIVRKMLESRSRERGSCSRATRSWSSWSRFSWLSTRNSSTMSSRPSTPASSPWCAIRACPAQRVVLRQCRAPVQVNKRCAATFLGIVDDVLIMVLRAHVDNSATRRPAQFQSPRRRCAERRSAARPGSVTRPGTAAADVNRRGSEPAGGAEFRQERNLRSGSVGECARQPIEQGGDGGQVGQPVRRRGLALADLHRDVPGPQRPEAVLVGDVVTEVEHALGTELVAQPQQRGALVRVGDRELQHVLARLRGVVRPTGGGRSLQQCPAGGRVGDGAHVHGHGGRLDLQPGTGDRLDQRGQARRQLVPGGAQLTRQRAVELGAVAADPAERAGDAAGPLQVLDAAAADQGDGDALDGGQPGEQVGDPGLGDGGRRVVPQPGQDAVVVTGQQQGAAPGQLLQRVLQRLGRAHACSWSDSKNEFAQWSRSCLAMCRRIARIRREASAGSIRSARSSCAFTPAMSCGLTSSACFSSAAAPANSLSTSTPPRSPRAATYSLATRFIPSR